MSAPRASSGMLRSRLRASGSTLLPATPTAAPPSSPLVQTPSAALPGVTSSLSTTAAASPPTSLSFSFFPYQHAASSSSSLGQIRAASTEGKTGRDDLGGPGGQQPVPSAPGGAQDSIQRNWLPISGGALLLVGFYAYLTGGGPPSNADQAVDKVKQQADLAKDQTGSKLRQGQEKTGGLKSLEGKEVPGVAEVSGRKSNMGGVGGE